jgi:hypothetical protein
LTDFPSETLKTLESIKQTVRLCVGKSKSVFACNSRRKRTKSVRGFAFTGQPTGTINARPKAPVMLSVASILTRLISELRLTVHKTSAFDHAVSRAAATPHSARILSSCQMLCSSTPNGPVAMTGRVSASTVSRIGNQKLIYNQPIEPNFVSVIKLIL